MIDAKKPESGDLEMKSWLAKLKENQEHRREDRLKKYNDAISKFIIVLLAICILCMIAVSALLIQNEQLSKQNQQWSSNYNDLNASKNSEILQLASQNQQLQSDNNDLKNFIFSNRSINDFQHTVLVDPSLPKVSKITFNTNEVTIQFADGTQQVKYFIDYNINITNPGSAPAGP